MPEWSYAAQPDQWGGSAEDKAWADKIRAQTKNASEDFDRFKTAQIVKWRDRYDAAASQAAGRPQFRNDYGDIVDKPSEDGPNSRGRQALFNTGRYTNPNQVPMGGGGGGGGGMGGPGGGGPGGPWGGGTFGGAPGFYFGEFKPPSYQEAMADPGYQFALKQGADQLQGSAAAQGLLRTSGTLKDLMNYGQQAAAQQYQNVYNRAANTYGINLGTAKDIFAPQYGSWQTKYGGDLQKYLQREGNIYGLLNPSMPGY